MRRSLVLGLLVLACRGGIKAPETIPVAPGVLDSIPPAIAPSPVDTSARAAVQEGTPGRALIAAGWPLTQRVTPVTGEHAMVVTSHPLASDVGVDVLRRGGNAVDAAVAVAFALAVVHPVAGNIGGGGFMVTRMHEGTVGALDFRETAPTRATRDMYVDTAGNAISSSLTGHRSVGVPGTVAGMYEAHRKFGRLPWKELLVPAITLARDGYLLDGPRSHVIEREAERLGRFPASRAQFLVDGVAPPPGTRFVQPELARTLQLIADSGAAPFYDGSIAHLIVREMARGGGLITRRDLAHYVAKWRDPVAIRYRGYTIYTMPPPSGGGVTLAEILNVMEGYAPVPPFGSAELLHLQAEAMRRAYTDRNALLVDPDFVQMPLERHLNEVGITQQGVAVGVRAAHRLGLEVQQLRTAERRNRSVPLHHIENLRQGHAAAGRRRHRIDRVAPIADRDGVAPLGDIVRQVVARDQPAAARHLAHNQVSDAAGVERRGAAVGDQS